MDRNYFEAVFRVVHQICTMVISFVCTFKNNLRPLTLTRMTCPHTFDMYLYLGSQYECYLSYVATT